jgi:hypothetical protein
MHEKLFVGGPWDGRRVSVKSGQKYVTVPKLVPRGVPYTCVIDLTVTVEKVHYIAREFGAEGVSFYVFAPSEWSPADIMTQLIEGYSKKLTAKDQR